MTAARKPRERQSEQLVQLATTRMNALEELRCLKGLLVPVPAGLNERAAHYTSQSKEPEAIQVNERIVRDACAWLSEVAKAGGMQDVDRAWGELKGNKSFKGRLRNEYESLRLSAERRYFELARAAQLEEHEARREWQRKQDVLKLKNQRETHLKAIADIDQQLAKIA